MKAVPMVVPSVRLRVARSAAMLVENWAAPMSGYSVLLWVAYLVALLAFPMVALSELHWADRWAVLSEQS